VIAELGGDPGSRGAPADHRIGVRLRQHGTGELAGAAADRAEQRPLGSSPGLSGKNTRLLPSATLRPAWRKADKLGRADGPAATWRDTATGAVTREVWYKGGQRDRAGAPAVIQRDADRTVAYNTRRLYVGCRHG
jgi:hypothetical protein